MALGRMNTFIDITGVEPTKDAEGFVTQSDIVVASVRAYVEDRHGSVAWRNRAAFSEATALFRFRVIPGVTVTTANVIVCGGDRYKILSVEDVKRRNMYYEVLAERIVPTER